MASSKDPKTGEEIEEIVETEETKRKNIRENRLAKWQEFADQDQQFQKAALEGMKICAAQITDAADARNRLFGLLERMVVAVERNSPNTTYSL